MLNIQAEILWCAEQLEQSIHSGKLSEKKMAEVKKSIKNLKNPKTPLVKIRQIMRANFGDFRAKIAAENKSSKLDDAKVKITDGIINREKTTFIKKSAAKSGSKDENTKTDFKFSFNVNK